MPVVPFNPYVVHARRAARDAAAHAAAARDHAARQRVRLPDTPPPPPKLRVNLSPPAAMRTLCRFGLGVAGCATVAATLTMITAVGEGDPRLGPPLLLRATAWLAALPWLFLGVALSAIASIERLVARPDARTWRGLSLVVLGLAAAQALGALAIEAVPPLVRVGVLVTAVGLSMFALRAFFSADSGSVRLQIAGGVLGGLFVATAPFALAGQALLPAPEHTWTLTLLLGSCDALLGVVVATWAVHATLVYVRDYLPDFTIALDTADMAAAAPVPAPAVPRR